MPRILVLRPGPLGSSGLWIMDGRGRSQPVDSDELDLSDELADAIEAWLDDLDARVEGDDPADARFADEADRGAWLAEGRALAQSMAQELGPDWQVVADLAAWCAP